jgi:hypothetical protein
MIQNIFRNAMAKNILDCCLCNKKSDGCKLSDQAQHYKVLNLPKKARNRELI